ncbi:MAG: DNA-directed DNA polymerase II small subunit [Promethearchaeota archaeon]
MSTNDSDVQKAISKLIKAGFQISPETLSMLQIENNPHQMVVHFLASKTVHPSDTPILEPSHFRPAVQEKTETTHEDGIVGEELHIPKPSATKRIAETVNSDIKIIKDPTSELQSKGTIDDFMKNFRDRYFRIRDIISQRVDGKGVVDIKFASEMKESKAKEKGVKIVGIVNNKSLTRSGNIALEVEDPTGRIGVIIQQRDPKLISKANTILLDQVLLIEGDLVSSEMLLAKDLYLPDIPSNRRNHRAKEDISVLLISDIHYGSRHFLDKVFQRAIEWLQGNEGDEEHVALAGSVKYIVINGDLVDGIGVYPNQLSEITIFDIDSQFSGLNKFLQEIPTHIEILIAPGNHDGVRVAIPRPAIADHYFDSLRDAGLRIHSLGCPAQVNLHGVNIMIYHGDSLVDIMGALSKPEVEASYAAMREMLRGRHLAPIYGKSTTVVAEPRDWLVIDEVPDILHCGHIHVTSVGSYRNTLMVNSGTFQSQTEYQKLIGIEPTPGIVPLVNLKTLNVKTLNFT